MAQPTSLRDMARTGSPNHGILERFFQCAVYLVTHILDVRFVADNQCFTEVWLYSLSKAELAWVLHASTESFNGPFRVDPH